jgi:hypothetical protein
MAADSVTADKVAFNYAASASKSGAAVDLACTGCVSANEVSFSYASLGANNFTGRQNVDVSSGVGVAASAQTGLASSLPASRVW